MSQRKERIKDDMSDGQLSFETAMQRGIDAHARGEYREALEYRLLAFTGESPEPYDRGRAARDIAASFDRLGDTNLGDNRPGSNRLMAEAYAEYAYRQHKTLHDAGNERGSREFTVSAMYAGILAARQNRGKEAVGFIEDGWVASEHLREKHGKPHQYDVNMSGRMAALEALFGDLPKRYLRVLGNRAISLSFDSETDRVLEPNTRLTEAQVRRAQRKAFKRGLAARTIVASEALPTRKFTRPLAEKLLHKAIL